MQHTEPPLHQSTRTWAVQRRGRPGVDVVTTALVIEQFGAGVRIRFLARQMPSAPMPRSQQAHVRGARREL